MLQSKRCVLYELRAEDANDIYELRQDPDNGKYTGIAPYNKHEQAQIFVTKVLKQIAAKQSYYWVIKKEQQFIGTICLWNINKERNSAEIGYEILKGEQRKGYATESVQTVVAYAFEKLGFSIIEGCGIDSKNRGSQRILEKNGFVRIKTEPDETFTYQIERTSHMD